jgi:arsenite/tail-anchored protein-transporting ATPase
VTSFALPIHDRPILFVGGKGGVGKTTTAAALGMLAAESDEKVLVVSTDPAHSLADLFEEAIGDRIRELLPGLHALEVDPDAQVEAYLGRVRQNLKSFVRPAMYSEIDRQIELTRHSPGAVEAALLERVAELMESAGGEYDRVIFDTAPTGHTLRLLALPEIMQAWTDGLLRSRERSDSFGRALDRLRGREEGETSGSAADSPARKGDDLSWFEAPDDAPSDPRARRIREVLLERRRRFSRARRLLLDTDTTAFILVLTPERLPILESRKALEVLERHGVPVAGLVVNRVLPAGAMGEFMERRRDQEAQYLERIDREFAALPRVRIPLQAGDVERTRGLREVARVLAGS